MKLEVCAFSLESCLAAQKGGADRVELCASMYEGGTTPSAGLMKEVLKTVTIEVHVMIRPRGGDFCYTPAEIAVMKSDIEMAKLVGCHGIVLGILQKNGKVNTKQTTELVQLAQPLQVTFHRAFDMTPDPFEALESIIETGCNRILMAGQQNKVTDGLELLKALVKQSNHRIEIMAGSGVTPQNALKIAQMGIDTLHLSGKTTRDSEMEYRKEGIFMGGLPQIPEYEIAFTDWQKIAEVKGLLL